MSVPDFNMVGPFFNSHTHARTHTHTLSDCSSTEVENNKEDTYLVAIVFKILTGVSLSYATSTMT